MKGRLLAAGALVAAAGGAARGAPLGVTTAEVREPLPGDAVVQGPLWVCNARYHHRGLAPSAVWPWGVQR